MINETTTSDQNEQNPERKTTTLSTKEANKRGKLRDLPVRDVRLGHPQSDDQIKDDLGDPI